MEQMSSYALLVGMHADLTTVENIIHPPAPFSQGNRPETQEEAWIRRRYWALCGEYALPCVCTPTVKFNL